MMLYPYSLLFLIVTCYLTTALGLNIRQYSEVVVKETLKQTEYKHDNQGFLKNSNVRIRESRAINDQRQKRDELDDSDIQSDGSDVELNGKEENTDVFGGFLLGIVISAAVIITIILIWVSICVIWFILKKRKKKKLKQKKKLEKRIALGQLYKGDCSCDCHNTPQISLLASKSLIIRGSHGSVNGQKKGNGVAFDVSLYTDNNKNNNNGNGNNGKDKDNNNK